MSGACVFDIDGVLVKLSGTSGCRGMDSGGFYPVSYSMFRSAGIDALSSCRSRGFRVYIVSGRSVNCMDQTLEELTSMGVVFDRIFLRDPSRYRSVVEFKVNAISSIVSRFSYIEVHDDDPEVLRVIKRRLYGAAVSIKLFLHSDDSFAEF